MAIPITALIRTTQHKTAERLARWLLTTVVVVENPGLQAILAKNFSTIKSVSKTTTATIAIGIAIGIAITIAITIAIAIAIVMK